MTLFVISIQIPMHQCINVDDSDIGTFRQFSVDVVFENVGSNFSRDDLLHSPSQH